MGKHSLSRKKFLQKSAAITGGIFAAELLNKISGFFSSDKLFAAPADDRLIVVTGSDISKETIEKMVQKAFADLGGINGFIKRGMKVVIKPNIAWNSPPESAANTNPHLVETVARMCRNAGAKVTIFDRTCSSARSSYKRSGIEDAAKNAGVNIEFIDDRKFIDVKVPGGLNLTTLSVYKPIIDADFVINMPIAKHHSISQLTISMKNLMGVIGGNRGMLHFNMNENLVDFTKTIKTNLTICDCIRILTAHGPNSGTPEDVKETRTIIVGRNPVTVDAYAATLFGRSPSNLKFLVLANKENMGEINPAKMNIRKITV